MQALFQQFFSNEQKLGGGNSYAETWIQSPADFCKSDLSKLTTLVNFLSRTGTDCTETSAFPLKVNFHLSKFLDRHFPVHHRAHLYKCAGFD
jgi:hypothetical protein